MVHQSSELLMEMNLDLEVDQMSFQGVGQMDFLEVIKIGIREVDQMDLVKIDFREVAQMMY